MRLFLLSLACILSFSAFSQKKYGGKNAVVITFEANAGYDEIVFESSELNIKLLYEQANFQFNVDINTFKKKNTNDTIILSQLLPTLLNPVINFTGDFPAAVTLGNSTSEQSATIRGQLSMNGINQIIPLNLKIWTKDNQAGYSFIINQDLKIFNIILPEKYTKQLTGKFRIVSSGGMLNLR